MHSVHTEDVDEWEQALQPAGQAMHKPSFIPYPAAHVKQFEDVYSQEAQFESHLALQEPIPSNKWPFMHDVHLSGDEHVAHGRLHFPHVPPSK